MKNENIIEIDGKKYKQTFELIEPEIPAKPEKPKKIELERFVFEDVELKVRKVNPPKGLIVHFHAGHRDGRNNSLNCLRSGARNEYKYICLEEDGVLHFPKNDKTKSGRPSFYGHGWHCGTKHNDDHVGVEVICSGKLGFTQGIFRTWFKKIIPGKDVRKVKAKDNVKAGYYHTFTDEQEKALVDLCLYLDANYESFSLDNVLGHDEVAPSRKNDPGGSLSMTMPEFRDFLKAKKRERAENE